jgi:hypothetical protein
MEYPTFHLTARRLQSAEQIWTESKLRVFFTLLSWLGQIWITLFVASVKRSTTDHQINSSVGSYFLNGIRPMDPGLA